MTKYIIAAALLLALPVSAQDNTLFEATVAQIVDSNAALEALHQKYIAEAEALKAENVIAGPEAEFAYKFAPRGEQNRWGASIGQSFDWPGLYRQRAKTARYTAQAFHELYQAERLHTSAEARQLLLDYIQLKQDSALLAQAKTNLTRLDSILAQMAENGNASILYAKKVHRELFNLNARLANISAQLTSTAQNIQAMGDGNIDLGGIDAYPLMALMPLHHYRDALRHADPAIAAHYNLAGAAASAEKAAHRASLPSFTLAYNHDFEDGIHFNGFSVGISLPQWTSRHNTAAAKAETLAAQFETDDYVQQTLANLTAEHTRASLLGARLAPAKTDFGADNYLTLLEKSFNGGQITLFEYLREINEHIDFQLELNSLEHDYCSSLARLNRFELARQ